MLRQRPHSPTLTTLGKKGGGGFRQFLENVGLGLTSAFPDSREEERRLACLGLSSTLGWCGQESAVLFRLRQSLGWQEAALPPLRVSESSSSAQGGFSLLWNTCRLRPPGHRRGLWAFLICPHQGSRHQVKGETETGSTSRSLRALVERGGEVSCSLGEGPVGEGRLFCSGCPVGPHGDSQAHFVCSIQASFVLPISPWYLCAYACIIHVFIYTCAPAPARLHPTGSRAASI